VGSRVEIKNVITRERIGKSGRTIVYYLAQVPASLLADVTFVPVVADEANLGKQRRKYLHESDNGYQRPGMARRMEAFGTYLAERDAAYIPAIVLSSRGKWIYDKETRSITVEAPAAIIDGQHRTGGYISAYQKDEIDRLADVVVLNISIEEEEELFIDINSNAKSVPTGLVSVLGRSQDALVAGALNNNSDSIFHNRFYLVQRRDGTLFNIASVAKQIGVTFSNGVFEGIKDDLDLKYDIMAAYWDLIASEFPVEWKDIDVKQKDREYKLLELTGLIAMSYAADEILAPAFDMKSSSMDYEKVEATIKYLADCKLIDWSKNGEFQNQTGFGGGTPIHRKIQQVLALRQN